MAGRRRWWRWCAMAIDRRRGRGRWWWKRCSSGAGLLLLLAQKVHNELLVVLDEVVRQALVGQILTKVFPPQRVEGIKQGEF